MISLFCRQAAEIQTNKAAAPSLLVFVSLSHVTLDKVQKIFHTAFEFRRPDFQLIRNRLYKRRRQLS